jgi:hypothetical protein
MFLKNSRYHALPTVACQNDRGEEVLAVTLRRLPAVAAEQVQVRDHDQLDILSQQRFKDGTRFWHIADANSELEANELVRVTGRTINIPPK